MKIVEATLLMPLTCLIIIAVIGLMMEFYSELDLPVGADCLFRVYGDDLRSQISYKCRQHGDSRWFYRSGELAVTATEKLKGVKK